MRTYHTGKVASTNETKMDAQVPYLVDVIGQWHSKSMHMLLTQMKIMWGYHDVKTQLDKTVHLVLLCWLKWHK